MKAVIIFPGIGYTVERPLLYYAGKLAAAQGYDTRIPVQYSFRGGNIRGDREKMQEAFTEIYGQAEKMLSGIHWDEYDEVLFISKSIGTAVAAAYAARHGLRVKHLLYTPLAETFLWKPQNAIAFIGTEDPWSEIGQVRTACEELSIPLTVVEGANHSLETGDLVRDIGILEAVMKESQQFLS